MLCWEQLTKLQKANNIHHAAYIGSTLDCLADMKSIHNLALTQPNMQIRNNNLYVSDNARVLYDELLYRFPADPERGPTCLDNFDNILNGNDHRQFGMTKTIQQIIYEKFIKECTIKTRLRVESCQKEATVLITTGAKLDEFYYAEKNRSFLYNLYINLGIDLPFIKEQNCRCNSGSRFCDKQGLHTGTQCPLGNHRQTRHNGVQKVWADLFRKSGYTCMLESMNLLRSVNEESQARTDITVNNWENAIPLELDITITDPRNLSDVLTHIPSPQEAAKRAEARKINKYNENINRAGGLFKPLVMETFGRFGDIARNIFKKLIDIIAINSGKEKSWLSTYWKSKLVVNMRKLYIQGMRNHFSSLNIQESELSLQSQEEIENINYQNIFLPFR